jgi:hypothetical protein
MFRRTAARRKCNAGDDATTGQQRMHAARSATTRASERATALCGNLPERARDGEQRAPAGARHRAAAGRRPPAIRRRRPTRPKRPNADGARATGPGDGLAPHGAVTMRRTRCPGEEAIQLIGTRLRSAGAPKGTCGVDVANAQRCSSGMGRASARPHPPGYAGQASTPRGTP